MWIILWCSKHSVVEVGSGPEFLSHPLSPLFPCQVSKRRWSPVSYGVLRYTTVCYGVLQYATVCSSVLRCAMCQSNSSFSCNLSLPTTSNQEHLRSPVYQFILNFLTYSSSSPSLLSATMISVVKCASQINPLIHCLKKRQTQNNSQAKYQYSNLPGA